MHWLNESEVSAILGVPKRTLSDWRYRAKGPAFYRFGRHVRYTQEDVNAFIAEQRRTSTRQKGKAA